MEIGFLTSVFPSLDEAIDVALELDVGSLELAHDDVDRVRAAGLNVAALARYRDWGNLEPHIRLAADKGVGAVSTLAGFPEHRDELRELLEPAVATAGRLGIQLAFENWYRTNLRTLEDWRWFLTMFPQEHVGLVFDPSHLEWQRIDWQAAFDEFQSRVVFVHAKDVAYDANGDWRYVAPGRGVIDWSRLDYDGFVSIEHEDDERNPRAGVTIALEHLRSQTTCVLQRKGLNISICGERVTV